MTSNEKQKIKVLIQKYNPILKESVEIALVEDLFNLIIVNRDDADFELKELLKDKKQLKKFVMKEFIQLNNKPLTSELKNMDEPKFKLTKRDNQINLKF
ncbi:MAG: hypothetical protein COW67_13800 [Flavobacteriales bacterium CG18_big_fil_WC_8_21_14_2_50_32_9]|nr:hypothetical protein [Flavobacteriales bacterium]PIQ14447.1 MAG: hypothetical protein COW67_13800 [Flavobacteriales bacterium CG18_big_fil_WC_8_21_14_2_50_32_9]